MKTKEERNALKDEELKNVAGGMKIVVQDDDPEELSWWEKLLKILFRN